MFNIEDYVISMQDKVETGRTKINFLFSGDSSPFNIWSGTPESLPYESLYRIDENESNYITFRTDSLSDTYPFGLIFNGSNNLIDSCGDISTTYGGYNLIDGLDNTITNSWYNTLIGSGNNVLGQGTSDGYNFIHGTLNSTATFFPLPTNSFTVSSKKSTTTLALDYTLMSSKNSYMIADGFAFNQFSFLSGDENRIGANFLTEMEYCFIGGGSSNNILSRSPASHPSVNTAKIINGTNNTVYMDTLSGLSVNLFGSNLEAVTNNYSHFENLYIDESLMCKSYDFKYFYYATTTSTAITVNTNYSFHAFFQLNTCNELSIQIPKPDNLNSCQVLSILINVSKQNLDNIYFVDWSEDQLLGFPTRATLTPTQIAAKNGANSGTNRMITSLPTVNYVAYFFMWIPLIQKWVMYTADTSLGATF